MSISAASAIHLHKWYFGSKEESVKELQKIRFQAGNKELIFVPQYKVYATNLTQDEKYINNIINKFKDDLELNDSIVIYDTFILGTMTK